jgi:hypothetical protein
MKKERNQERKLSYEEAKGLFLVIKQIEYSIFLRILLYCDITDFQMLSIE